MAYLDKEKEKLLITIFKDIESGDSLRQALINSKLSSQTFYIWIEEDKEKSKQYARACEDRAEKIADEILEICDSSEADAYVDDGVTKIDGNTVQRARLQVDTRKWLLGKLNPKKYGDKVTLSGDAESPLITAIQIRRIEKPE